MFGSNVHQHLHSENNLLYLSHNCSLLGLLQFQYMSRHPNELVHFQYQTRQMSRQQHLKITKKQTIIIYAYTIVLLEIKEASRLNWNVH